MSWKGKKIAALALAAVMGISYTGYPVHAQEETGNEEGITAYSPERAAALDISAGDITIASDGDYTITGQTGDHKIVIAENVLANITLDNMKALTPHGNLEIRSGAKVYITLTGDNIIQAHQDGRGNAVNIADDAELHFTADSTGSIILHGASLYWGGSAAVKGGNLYIHGGTVTMIGGNKIVGDYGKSYDVKTITVTGGTVNCYQGVIDSTEPGSSLIKSPLPEFTAEQTMHSITVNLGNYKSDYGEAEYSIDGVQWQSANVFLNLTAGTEYTVYVRYKGMAGYSQSDVSQLKVKTRQDGETVIQEPEPKGVYGQKLSEVTLPEGWSWKTPDLVLNENVPEFGVGYMEFTARFDVSEYEDEYDFSGVAGYNRAEHCVERELKVFVSMAPSTISFKDGFTLDKQYDGYPAAVSRDDVLTTGSSGRVEFKYEKQAWSAHGTEYWQTLPEAPTGAGSYKVTAILWHDDWHDTASAELPFTISKADTELRFTVDNVDKDYDGKTVNPSTYQSGSSHVRVLSWYRLNDNGEWEKLEKAPVNAGNYKVVASVEGDDNYNSAETEMTFQIRKARPSYTLPQNLTVRQGELLSSVELSAGFEWLDDTQTADKLGAQTFKARFVPEDTENYQTVEVDISLEVVSASPSENPEQVT